MALVPGSRLYSSIVTVDHTGTAYSAGDALGGKLSFSAHDDPGRGILLHKILSLDLEIITVNDHIVHLFAADFTASTDNAAFSIADADAPNYCGSVAITAANMTTITSTFDYYDSDVSRAIYLTGRSLYLQCATDQAFDSVGTSQLKLRFIYERLN